MDLFINNFLSLLLNWKAYFHHICWSCIYPPQTLPRSSHSPSIQFHHLCFTLCVETCINMFVCIHKHIFKRYHDFQYVFFFSTVLDNLIGMLPKILDLAKYFFLYSEYRLCNDILFYFIYLLCWPFTITTCGSYFPFDKKCWPILCLPVSCIDLYTSFFLLIF